ncbi:MAG: septum formation initiator family protein [bacterium]
MYIKERNTKTGKLFMKQASVAIVCLVIAVAIGAPLVKKVNKQRAVNKEIRELEEEIKELEGKNSELKTFLEYLDSDQYIDEQARLNLNYKKTGEEVAVITGLENAENSLKNSNTKAEDSEAKGSISNPQKWFKHFFK